jgi:hypothetical protein
MRLHACIGTIFHEQNKFLIKTCGHWQKNHVDIDVYTWDEIDTNTKIANRQP